MTLTRKVPLKSKRPGKPRRVAELHCSGRTKAGGPCRSPIRFERWCQRHAIKEADRLFSRYVRLLRDGRCRMCGSEVNLDCAHIFSRGYMATRWDPLNAVALCSGHHKEYTHLPLEWEDWCREVLGSEVYDELRLKARRGGMPDVGHVIQTYRRILTHGGVALR